MFISLTQCQRSFEIPRAAFRGCDTWTAAGGGRILERSAAGDRQTDRRANAQYTGK
jgi:hypothetical protein